MNGAFAEDRHTRNKIFSAFPAAFLAFSGVKSSLPTPPKATARKGLPLKNQKTRTDSEI